MKTNIEGKRLLLLEHVNDQASSPKKTNLKLIRNEVNKLAGNFIKPDGEVEAFLLTCAVCDEDDYYYLLIDRDRKIRWESCVGSIKAVDESRLGVEYNILRYLIENDSEYLLDMVQKIIDDSGVVLFTDLKVK
jgi:hypothetical protein